MFTIAEIPGCVYNCPKFVHASMNTLYYGDSLKILRGTRGPRMTKAAEKGLQGRNRDYPRLPIVIVEDLLAGKTISMPPTEITFKQAEKLGE